jgi:hypothetical protein
MTSPVKVKREKEKKEETHFVVDEPDDRHASLSSLSPSHAPFSLTFPSRRSSLP